MGDEKMIDSYEFGKICVDGKVYTQDIIIYPDHVESNWWRKSGHSLSREDITGIIANKPDLLIIGTGAYGVMRVPEDVRRWIEAQGIAVRIEPTGKAVKLFNELSKEKRVVSALHLTC